MDKDDIIKLAREAGMPMVWISNSGVLTWTELIAFANLVAATERESCAKLCDRMAARCNDIRAAALESAAENIRARGNT